MFQFVKNLFRNNKKTELLREAILSGAYLIDVRTPAEFASGSVRGAVNIPLDKIQGSVDKLKIKKQIVVFCKSGTRSMLATKMFKLKGVDQVINGGSWHHVNALLKD